MATLRVLHLSAVADGSRKKRKNRCKNTLTGLFQKIDYG